MCGLGESTHKKDRGQKYFFVPEAQWMIRGEGHGAFVLLCKPFPNNQISPALGAQRLFIFSEPRLLFCGKWLAGGKRSWRPSSEIRAKKLQQKLQPQRLLLLQPQLRKASLLPKQRLPRRNKIYTLLWHLTCLWCDVLRALCFQYPY